MTRLEQARRIETSLMSERKKRMNEKSHDMLYVTSINVGSVVYLYQPVVVTGKNSKLSLPFIQIYTYVCVGKVTINWLKVGFI